MALKLEALLVLAAFGLMVVSNVLSVVGVFGKENGELSDENPTYVSPDGTTFIVWGFIYAGEALMTIAQIVPSESVERLMSARCRFTRLSVRMRLVCAFLANAVWLPLFSQELFTVALVVIVIYLAFLLSAYSDINVSATCNLCDALVVSTGVALNASWIIVASIVNIFVAAGVQGWRDEYGVAGSVPVAIAAVVAVGLLGCERAIRGGDLPWALVAGWAAWGIQRMQTTPEESRFPTAALNGTLAAVAGTTAIVVFAVVALTACMLVWRRSDLGSRSKGEAEAAPAAEAAAEAEAETAETGEV